MCGLFGVAQSEHLSLAQVARADASRDLLAHRGPDYSGRWNKGGVYVGHRRLSIIDTSPAGNQPMVADDLVIAVNGEIYNFRSLRAELENAGHVFTSQSDSEVVLHGYRHWGLEELVERMDGMYAAVIYDEKRNLLLTVRDRVGIKPFYYYFDGKTFVWASELKAIVDYVGPDTLEVDHTAVIDFLACRHIPPPKSMYRNVFKLPPARTLKLDINAGNLTVASYWQPPLAGSDSSDEKLAEELVSLLRESVHEQLVSDVPLGLLLSGGIDSSAVAALACEKDQLLSFSIGFDDPGRDETPFAQQVARHTDARHHSHYFDDEEMEGLPDRMANWFDEPFSNHSAVPTFRVCSLARQHVTVALCGDGGDELLGGYKWYASYAEIRRLQKWWPVKFTHGLRLPGLPRRRAFELLTITDPVALYARLRGSLPEHRLKHWKRRLGVVSDYDSYWAYRQHFHPHLSPRKAAQVMDFNTYLPNEMLTKVDRVSMAVSLECRPPFLSRKFVEFALSLPESFVYKDGRLKGGLKFALRSLLPRAILDRDKQGFSVADSGWRKHLTQKHGSIQEAIIDRFMANS